jgi:glycosyltransferase involved in cell wall biosynthesis
VPLVLEIWNQIHQRDEVELNMAGSGPMEGVVRSIKDRNFKYFGFVEEEELSGLISQCDIFIYPSTCDNYGLVILQALSSGLYVITNEMIASSFSEFVNIGQLKVVENKPNSYIEAIIHYLENGITFDLSMSRSTCINKYDWKVISEKLYNTLLFEYHRKIDLYL